MSSSPPVTYRINNAVFNSPVGIASSDKSPKPFHPIVGTRWDSDASLKFGLSFTEKGRAKLYIEGCPVVLSNRIVCAASNVISPPDEFVLELVSEANFRRLYKICWASSRDLVWTLNSAIEPANSVFLSPDNPDAPYNPRQLWYLEYQPL
ncbi:hypothetical protein D9756_009532 [Leucocoprinus leucothites]|uniref:Uncharacterized protein n=1 Tax=Leucocoprinus leucothites TaxID=201217 RepID=A0A8H5CYU6_9AGAR|nr:hypothetical protein D9756_009532 [Leucoagaricus leucothites]